MKLSACGAEAVLLMAFWAGALGVRLCEHRAPPNVEATGELPADDGLQLLPEPKGLPLKDKVGKAAKAKTLQAWRSCKAWAKETEHRVDSVASRRGNFFFIDNVKAGSTSVRTLLENVLDRTWQKTDLPFDGNASKRGCTGFHGPRLTTTSFAPETIARLFRFSIVRDPVAKFESGVRQTWFQMPNLANLTADEILDRQLELWPSISELGQPCKGNWLNEHLQPNSWRLSSYRSDGKMMDLDFIAKIENFDEEWPAIVEAMDNISPRERLSLTAIGHDNMRRADPRSRLSPAGIRRMCQSETYRAEWECFGYPLPAECSR